MNRIDLSGWGSAYSSYRPIETAKSVAPEAAKTPAPEAAKINKVEDVGAVYEKSVVKKPATYTINRMSADDRAALVEQFKRDQENRVSQLQEIVTKMMTGQATTFAKTDDSLWKILASGKFSVDAATKARAEADIAEDGYWGVTQTSQRMFDFASALAGDDVKQMEKMQEAMKKGVEQATKTWGRDLPDICSKTIEAANKLFEDYYDSKAIVFKED